MRVLAESDAAMQARNMLLPTKVVKPEGKQVFEVGCGIFHTVVLVMTNRDGGWLYSWGYADTDASGWAWSP